MHATDETNGDDMKTTSPLVADLDNLAARLLSDAADSFDGMRGTAGALLPDGSSVELRILHDDTTSIGRWIDGDHDDDIFGVFAWRGRDWCTGLPAERPTHHGFDGRARVLTGYGQGCERLDGSVWWQPPADVPDADLPELEQLVRQYFAGDWGHVGFVVSIDDGRGAVSESALWGVDTADGLESAHAREVVADLLREAGAEAPYCERFRPTCEEDTAACFALLLTHVSDQLGAPSFAADMAFRGASRRAMLVTAARWREYGLEPPEFAEILEVLAPEFEVAR